VDAKNAYKKVGWDGFAPIAESIDSQRAVLNQLWQQWVRNFCEFLRKIKSGRRKSSPIVILET
jgi:hypothetical protein